MQINTNTTPVSVTLVPFTVEVSEADLDPDTLAQGGREAALWEAARAAAWEILSSGQVELQTSRTIPCSGTYEGHPGYVGGVCNRCGDYSNSDPGLPCGRILDGDEG